MSFFCIKKSLKSIGKNPSIKRHLQWKTRDKLTVQRLKAKKKKKLSMSNSPSYCHSQDQLIKKFLSNIKMKTNSVWVTFINCPFEISFSLKSYKRYPAMKAERLETGAYKTSNMHVCNYSQSLKVKKSYVTS